MTIVDELRREAEDALKETGMYYDVEYLSTIAKKVEAIVAENDRLRELVQEMYGFVKDVCELRPDVLMANNVPDWQVVDYRTPSERYAERLRELGIEVE